MFFAKQIKQQIPFKAGRDSINRDNIIVTAFYRLMYSLFITHFMSVSAVIICFNQLCCGTWSFFFKDTFCAVPSGSWRRQMSSKINKKFFNKKWNAGFNHQQLSWLMNKYKLECRVRHLICCEWIGRHKKASLQHKRNVEAEWGGTWFTASSSSAWSSLSHTAVMCPCKRHTSRFLPSFHPYAEGRVENGSRQVALKLQSGDYNSEAPSLHFSWGSCSGWTPEINMRGVSLRCSLARPTSGHPGPLPGPQTTACNWGLTWINKWWERGGGGMELVTEWVMGNEGALAVLLTCVNHLSTAADSQSSRDVQEDIHESSPWVTETLQETQSALWGGRRDGGLFLAFS